MGRIRNACFKLRPRLPRVYICILYQITQVNAVIEYVLLRGSAAISILSVATFGFM